MFGGGTLSPDAAAQNPTSASARVVSCRFFCADCGGDARSIFRQEYSSLEQGGAKALRCFSHCCPSRQSSSSNCGSSLHLLVTFSSDATAFRQSDELVVCCRFEPVAPSVSVGPQSGPHTLSLSVGEMVVLPSAEPTSSLSSDNWLMGKQESELNRSEFPKNTIVYVFNGNRHRQPRWIFHEDDSARGLKFQLVAYVFRPRPRSYDQQFAGERLIYRALGVLSTVIYRFPSPVFTILAGGTVHEECGSVDPPCKLKCHEPLERGGKLKASFENTAATASSATTAFNLAAQPIVQASHISHAWQLNHHISELSFSDKMLHLAIPLLFLEFTPFSAVGYFLVSRDNCTSSQRQGGSASAAQMTLWSTVQHQAAAASHVFDSSTEWFLPEDHEVVRESILLLLDVLTSSSIRQLTNSTFATAAATASVEIPTKLQFQQRFYDFVGNLYEAIVTLLRAREPEDSSLRISNLANKLLALIFKRAPFRPLRKVMSEMLLNRSLMPVIGALQTFTAQLREVYVTYWKTIADQQSARHTLPLSLASSLKDAHLRCWNGRWVMDDDETRVVPYGNVASGGVLAWLVCIQQLSIVDIQVSSASEKGDGHCWLAIGSAPIESAEMSTPTQSEGMHLVLDGRFRVFRTLPSGISSIATGVASRWDIGDYICSFASNSHNEIELQLFALGHRSAGNVPDSVASVGNLKPRAPSQCMSAYRLELTLSICDWRSLARQTQRIIDVQGNISVATLSTDRKTLVDMSTTDRGAKMAALYWVPLMTLHSRYKAVEIEYVVSL